MTSELKAGVYRVLAANCPEFRKSTMDPRTERIRADISEVRLRNQIKPARLNVEAVADDIGYLLDTIGLLLVENQLLRKGHDADALHAKSAETELETKAKPAVEAPVDMKAIYDRHVHAQMTQDLATQISHTMISLDNAGIADVGGPVETRTARRIDELAAQGLSDILVRRAAEAERDKWRTRAEKHALTISAVHEQLSQADIPDPVGKTLLCRLKPVLASWKDAGLTRKIFKSTEVPDARIYQTIATPTDGGFNPDDLSAIKYICR